MTSNTCESGLGSVVITGASSGLGKALALSYAKPGMVLGLIGRDSEKLAQVAELCEKLGAEPRVLATDVSEQERIASWLLALDEYAPVEILIASAGISRGIVGAFEGVASVTEQVNTNLLGVVNTIEPLLPAFSRRRRGSIAIISSVAALRGLPYSPGYCASKAGVRAYGEALRPLLAQFGVKLTMVCPGFFSSPMTDRWEGPTPLLISLEQAADRVRRAVKAGKRRAMFPFWLALGTRLLDLIPAVLGDAIASKFRFQIRAP